MSSSQRYEMRPRNGPAHRAGPTQRPARPLFDRLTGWGQRAPRITCLVSLLVLIVMGGLSLRLHSTMPAGGYADPNSQSAQATRVLQKQFGTGGMPIVFEVSAVTGVNSAPARNRGAQITDVLKRSGYAGGVTSYWTATTAAQRAAMLSRDKQIALVTAEIAGDDSSAPTRAADIVGRVNGRAAGVTVRAGGQAVFYQQLNEQNLHDLARAELIAIPISLLVLVWVFGSAIAAMVPVAMAVLSTVCTFTALRVLAGFTDISIFALSVASPLCLALAIDYTLFIINRYREEVAAGRSQREALHRTMNTTGRTVAYSALTVAVGLAVMMVFPVYFLRSVGCAGLIGVAFSAGAALIVAPAVIGLLGDRLDSWDIRRPVRRRLGRTPPRLLEPRESAWYRSTHAVMRRAIPIALLVGSALVALAFPIHSLRLGYPDDRVLTDSRSSRQVGDDLRTRFTANNTDDVVVVLPHVTGVSPSRLAGYGVRLSAVPGVTGVSGPGGSYLHGRKVTPTAPSCGARAGAACYVVGTQADPLSKAAAHELAAVRAVPPPTRSLFTGLAQQNLDDVAAITSRIPLVLALIAVSSFTLIFLFTGSVLLPLKALVMNGLSLSGALSVTVLIFQQGHLGGLGTTATGSLAATVPPLVFCIAFGLSMDYEVFMLSRIGEEWRTGSGSVADNSESVAVGLARTARLITTAGLLMTIVFASLTLAEVSFTRMLGLGLTLTILLDVFVVRPVLVPAVMRMAGRANWWSPPAVRAWHARHGFKESAGSP